MEGSKVRLSWNQGKVWSWECQELIGGSSHAREGVGDVRQGVQTSKLTD